MSKDATTLENENEQAAAPAGWYPVEGGALRRWEARAGPMASATRAMYRRAPTCPAGRKDLATRIAFGLIGLVYLSIPLALGRFSPFPILIGALLIVVAPGPVRHVREQLRFMGREVSPIVLFVIAVGLAVLVVVAGSTD